MASTTQVFCLAVAERQTRLSASSRPSRTCPPIPSSTAEQFVNFFTKTVVERTPLGQRAKIEEKEFLGHVFIRPDGLSCIMITTATYPSRTAFSILNRLADEFSAKFPQKSQWASMTPATTSPKYPELRAHLTKAQDPESADPFMRVQRELDETKIVLHKTMESLLQRGEKLDDLVTKSDQLSGASKAFYKTAKKTNSCCGM